MKNIIIFVFCASAVFVMADAYSWYGQYGNDYGNTYSVGGYGDYDGREYDDQNGQQFSDYGYDNGYSNGDGVLRDDPPVYGDRIGRGGNGMRYGGNGGRNQYYNGGGGGNGRNYDSSVGDSSWGRQGRQDQVQVRQNTRESYTYRPTTCRGCKVHNSGNGENNENTYEIRKAGHNYPK